MAAGSGSAPADFRRAALAAGLCSGVPSTVWALVRGTDALEATRAAGRIVLPEARSDAALIPAAALVHAALTLGWTAIIRQLPGGALRGAAYGLIVGVFDLGLARLLPGRRFAAIARLAVLPQLADHVAFGLLAGRATSSLSATTRARPSAPHAGR